MIWSLAVNDVSGGVRLLGLLFARELPHIWLYDVAPVVLGVDEVSDRLDAAFVLLVLDSVDEVHR
jgi:hypothetical protein